MTNAQKVIKYLALAFAIYLCFNIFSGIIMVIGAIVGLDDNDAINQNMNVISNNENNVLDLDIKLSHTSLDIVKGDSFKVETNNSNVKYLNENGKVEIKEEGSSWNKEKSILKVTIPSKINNLDIKTGAGSININGLTTNNFTFKSGAGEVDFDNLVVNNKLDIKGGAGEMDILNSNVNNLSLKLGVGEFDFSGILKGNSTIESGVGEVDVDLKDDISNYTIKLTKGLGEIKVNNNHIKNDTTYGNGSNLITVKGGVGSIEIN